MISRQLKDFYYKFASPFLRANGFIYKYCRKKTEPIRVQLGPGQRNYLNGWVNLDANVFTKIDVAVDLRYPLPFSDSSVDLLYSFHVIEHLPDLVTHFRDAFRVLKPGGIYRFGGPNGDVAINRFCAGDTQWFSDFPVKRESIGGRFENFIFCKGEHLTILLESFLTELCLDIGFKQIKKVLPVRESGFPDKFAECLKIEYEDNFDFPHSLVLEVVK